MANDMEMKVKITAETDDNQIKKEGEKAGKEIAEGVGKGTKSNKGAIAEIGKDAGETFGKSFSDRVNDFLFKQLKFETIKDAIVNIGTQIKDFLVNSVELANKYESAFAGVRKTVDGTEADFKRLDSSLRKMAKEIPIAYEDLASIMELGGQLGVDIQNMDKFTKVIAELGVATNMTAEESAQMLAQFANITKMDLNDIDKLGSVIVALGNNFATTENDITNFASRIAGAGQIAGISQANIMAIATAFSSVGIEAEAGGTAVQKVLLNMNNAVVQGGDQLELYAKTLGVTVEEFQNLFNAHPEQAFEEFVKGLSRAGDEAQLTLSELGLTDERLTRAFLSLAQNSGILTDAIKMSNEARDDNVALMNEAEQRFATTESQLIMLQNERANFMASIGEKLQGVYLTWEKIKTSVVETVAELSGVTMNTTELSDSLEGAIELLEQQEKALQKALDEGTISGVQYAKIMDDIENKKNTYLKTIDEEQKRIEKLQLQEELLQERIQTQAEYVRELTKAYGENSDEVNRAEFALGMRQEQLQRVRGEMVALREESENNGKQIAQETEITNKLTLAEIELEQAQNRLGYAQYDSSTSQEQMNELAKRAENATNKVYDLRRQLAELQGKTIVQNSPVKQDPFKGLNADEIKSKVLDSLKELGKEIDKEVGGINQDLNGIGSSGGSGKKSDPVAKAKEQAKKIRDEKIKALEQEELDELEKNKRLDEIYTEYKDKIIEIDGKTNDDLLKSAEDFLKEYRKNKQDEIAEEKKAGEDSIKNIEKYGKEIEKLGEKRQDYKNEAVKSLKEVNKELEDLEKENTENLADRYLEVEKAMREIEKENYGIQYDSSSIEQLKEYQKQGMDSYYGTDIETLIEYKKLQTEIALLEENTTEETIKEAEERKNLTETEKQLLEYEEKKTQLLEKQAILQATANQGDIDSERKALIEEDGVIKYYDAEKEAYTEITDYKNQELARQLLEKQTEMESEYQLNVEQKEKEEALLQDHYDKLQKLYQSDTDIYKGELAKKEKAVRDYVEKVKAMLSEIPASHRAYGGNLLNGQVSIVGENGPEAIIARQSSYVQPRNAVQNSSTVYNNQSSLSINGLEFGNFNNIDEMLIALKDKLTYRT